MHEPIDEVPIRQQDPWGSARGLLVLFLGVVGALVTGWGLGILALPSGQAGIVECERTCASLGTGMASFDGDVCTCNEL